MAKGWQRWAGLLLLGTVLGGCMSPPARWAAQDMQVRTVELPISTTRALGQLYDGLQYCGTYGIPDCAPLREDGTGACDLYHSAIFGGRSSNGIGRITLQPTATGCSATLGIGSQPAWTSWRYERMFTGWTAMLEGRGRELCP
jgi:hypothetical protein